MKRYIVTNPPGLQRRSQMSTVNPFNIKGKLSNGEGFDVYEVYTIKANQKWGRITDNPGDVQQEYVCLSIGNKTFAREELAGTGNTAQVTLAWCMAVDRFLRDKLGYTGPSPFEL
jgi:hypothetical protein